MGEYETEKLRGVGHETAKDWAAKGYDSLEKIVNATSEQLCRDLKLNVAKAQKYIRDASEIIAEKQIVFETGQKILDMRELIIKRISTGCKRFDEILGGGIQTDASTIFIGSWGSGKTQTAQQLAVNNILDFKRKSVFLSTEPSTFVPERFVQMAVLGRGYVPFNYDADYLSEILTRAGAGEFKVDKAKAQNYLTNAKGYFHFGKDEDESDIIVVRAQYLQDPNKIYDGLLKVEEKLIEEKGYDIGLIVVDSHTAPFRTKYLGRANLSDRSQDLARHIGIIERLSSKYNLAFVSTGQVYGNPDEYAQGDARKKTGIPETPWGGFHFFHSFTYQISLEHRHGGKKTENIWEAYLYDAPTPRQRAKFILTKEGVRDYLPPKGGSSASHEDEEERSETKK